MVKQFEVKGRIIMKNIALYMIVVPDSRHEGLRHVLQIIWRSDGNQMEIRWESWKIGLGLIG